KRPIPTWKRACSGPFTVSSWTPFRDLNFGGVPSPLRRPMPCGAFRRRTDPKRRRAMEYYRCENPDCGYLAEQEPDACPCCGGVFFLRVDEEDLAGSDWVQLGNRAVDEERGTDALACYQRAAAMDDVLGL